MTAVKIRLYPTNSQEHFLKMHLGATRYVYNRLLALKIFAYKRFGKNLSKFDLINRLVKLKKRKNTEWLKNVNAQSLQQAILNMDAAYQNFFERDFGYPTFKSRLSYCQSYQYPDRVKIIDKKIQLPRVGLIKCKGLRTDIFGKIKKVTISFEGGKYYASISYDVESKEIKNLKNKVIGIDVGITFIVTDSDEKTFKPLNIEKEENKIQKYTKQLYRKQKYSKNSNKKRIQKGKIVLRIKNLRKDFLHKISYYYSSKNKTVVIEDLKIAQMIKIAKNDNKYFLKNLILKQGWRIFFDFLNYKLKQNGGQLIKVNPKFTSQTCNKCGHISKENRLSQSKFICKSCGHKDNADKNAAKNIRDIGKKMIRKK